MKQLLLWEQLMAIEFNDFGIPPLFTEEEKEAARNGLPNLNVRIDRHSDSRNPLILTVWYPLILTVIGPQPTKRLAAQSIDELVREYWFGNKRLLPSGDHAIIDPRKLTDYCLSLDHVDGKHKAQLFQDLLGVTLNNAQTLLDALKEAASRGEAVVKKPPDKYGQRYVLDFECAGPTGTATVRSVWIIRTGEDVPRLVTCYIL